MFEAEKKSGFFKCRAQCAVKEHGTDDREHRIDPGGQKAEFGECFRDVLRQSEKVFFVEIPNERVSDDVKNNPADRGGHGDVRDFSGTLCVA